MKKLLILSENMGGGHNSCASAIRDVVLQNNPNCVVDLKIGLKFISPLFSSIGSKIAKFSYRYDPKIASYVTSQPDLPSRSKFVYWVLTRGCKKMYEYIKREEIDTVLCTHVFGAVAMSHVVDKHPELKCKTAFLATDYHCDLTGVDKSLDYYFIPDKTLINNFAETVNLEKIIPTGIPVRKQFFEKISRRDAKKIVHINPDNKHIVVMSGSMGCVGINGFLFELEKHLEEDVQVSVICGNNSKMYKQLIRHFRNSKNFHIYGVIDNVSVFMDSADLYVTKPGGISISEARVKKLPMVLINSVGGVETPNLEFFLKLGLAKTDESPSAIAGLCKKLINDEKALKTMVLSDYATTEELNAGLTIYKQLSD